MAEPDVTLNVAVAAGAFDAMAESAAANGLVLIEVDDPRDDHRRFVVRKAEHGQ